jgi:hypothetical protein
MQTNGLREPGIKNDRPAAYLHANEWFLQRFVENNRCQSESGHGPTLTDTTPNRGRESDQRRQPAKQKCRPLTPNFAQLVRKMGLVDDIRGATSGEKAIRCEDQRLLVR